MDKDQKENDGSIVDVKFPMDEHEEEVAEGGKKVLRRGIYFLPNLLTTGALFCGFYGIISAIAHNYDAACFSLFIAMVLDGLDGRVARIINAESKFGAEYDSLSDMVSFGVAPALVSFTWALKDLGKVGWMTAFFYAACSALRLARFNTQISNCNSKSQYFTGLPSPAAAALVTSFVWAFSDYGVNGSSILVAVMATVITGIAGVLMVSNFQYQSFKMLDMSNRVPFVFILFIIITFSVVFIDPPRVLLILFSIYAASGPVCFVVGWRTREKKNKSKEQWYESDLKSNKKSEPSKEPTNEK